MSSRPWPTDTFIAIRLNNRAYAHAKRPIAEGRFVADVRSRNVELGEHPSSTLLTRSALNPPHLEQRVHAELDEDAREA